ncbi:MAG: sensor histidine kinase [Clostridia bacterium]|nr:sensor histidine kinase [Clostridia bacterium]
MKKIADSLALKIAAVILSYITALCLVLSVFAVVVMGYYKFYFGNRENVTAEVLGDMAQKEAYYITNLMYMGENLSKYYSDKNVYFVVTERENGKIFSSNYNGEEYIASADSEAFFTDWYPIEELPEAMEKYGDEITVIGTDEFYVEREYEIKVYIAENMTKNDIFSVAVKLVEIGFKLQYAVIFIMLGSLIAFIVIMCYLYYAAGHKNGTIRLNMLDKLPFDVYAAIIAGVAIISVLGADIVNDLATAIIYIFIVGTVDYFFALGFTLSFATRVKTGTVIKNTLIYRLIAFLGKYFKKLFGWIGYIISNLSLVKKSVLLICVGIIWEIAMIAFMLWMAYCYADEAIILLLVPINIAGIAAVLYFSVILQKIKKGGERIAGGDLQYKIDTKYMYGEFKDFCNSLNNINKGLQAAVDEKMRSERFKTELITNVSHDIKTPLTSIINYVDLIKKENPENEAVRQYVEVLDRQSGRLKKLVEDLVEASKASTGNLSVNLTVCDVSVLLGQALGEFEEKLLVAGVKPVLRIPEKSICIMADGRHLWRVFDNLLSNVCKYALPGTRAYLDVEDKDGRVNITFRNISRYELNVSSDELMERFVRGDASRNTEGSGLGLSIAKSLVELQGGVMEICVDGDLFKATVSFDTAVAGEGV